MEVLSSPSPRARRFPWCSTSSCIVPPWRVLLNSVWLYFCLVAIPYTQLLWASGNRLPALSTPNQDQNVFLKHSTGLSSSNVLHFAFSLNFHVGSSVWDASSECWSLCFSALFYLCSLCCDILSAPLLVGMMNIWALVLLVCISESLRQLHD